MAQRPIWRGHLRLALVSCPVALYNAHHDRETLRFNLINPQTGHRIRMVSVDSETGDEVSRRDLVKGYEFKKNTYLLLDDEDFESVRVPSSTTMVIEKFVPVGALEPIYYDSSYYLAPDGEAGEDVFAIVRDAITESGKAALSHVVIARRERVVAIAPLGRGLVAHTLREQRDLNDAGEVFRTVPDTRSDPEMVKLARQLIDRQTGSYDPADVEDRYEARLRELIAAKLKGEGLAEDRVAAAPDSNVVDLMAALRRSIEQGGTERRASESTQAETPPPEQETANPAKRRAAAASVAPKKSARGGA
jgi:DNA end-binding protein Ku